MRSPDGVDGTGFVIGAGVALCALLLGITGGLWWFYATFSLDPAIPRELHLDAALGLGITAISLSVLAPWLTFRYDAPRWALVVAGLVLLALVAGVAYELHQASTAPRSRFDEVRPQNLWLLAACPTSWPALLLSAWGLRGRSVHERPAPQGR